MLVSVFLDLCCPFSCKMFQALQQVMPEVREGSLPQRPLNQHPLPFPRPQGESAAELLEARALAAEQEWGKAAWAP